MPGLHSPDGDDILVANDDDYKVGLGYSERILKESMTLMKRLDLPVTTLEAVTKIVKEQVGAAVYARFEIAQREKRKLVERYNELAGDGLDALDYPPAARMARGRALATMPMPMPRNAWDMTTDEIKAEIAKLENLAR